MKAGSAILSFRPKWRDLALCVARMRELSEPAPPRTGPDSPLPLRLYSGLRPASLGLGSPGSPVTVSSRGLEASGGPPPVFGSVALETITHSRYTPAVYIEATLIL